MICRAQPAKPIIEATAEEEEAPSVPPFLNGVGNWCLDADFSQNLNIISVSKLLTGSTLPCGLCSTVGQWAAEA